MTDISYAKKRLITLMNTLQDFRNNEINFNQIYNRIFEDSHADEPQSKRRETTFNLPNVIQNYRQIFNEILDTINNQIRIRFSDLDKLEFFDLVRKDKFNSYCKEFPESLFGSLVNHYSFFDPIALRNELITVYDDGELFKNCETSAEMIAFIFNK